MVSARATTVAVAFGVVGLGVMVALATDVAMNALSLAKLIFILGAFAMLIPTMALKDPKAYWLFLLVLSIPFDISKWLSDPALAQGLADKYGAPASGTVSLEVYVTDILLAAMLLPWLARVCMRRERLYFPSLAYGFVVYLGWALFVSMFNAQSFVLSMFELFRESMYFLLFVYLVNNLETRLQFRSVLVAIILGLIIGAGSVIVFFERGIGTDTVAFAFLHDQSSASAGSHKKSGKASDPQVLTLDTTGRVPLGTTEVTGVKRSQGMFGHPAIPASLCALILPIFLAHLLVARNNRDRILLVAAFGWGLAGLLLTFSRAGLIGLTVGCAVCFALGGWSGLISRRALERSAVIFASTLALGIPLITLYLTTRPGAFFMRFNMYEAALQGFAQHPFLGVGLNNATAAMQDGRKELQEMGIPVPPMESADSYYLATLIEIGPVGWLLFFGFFARIVRIALRTIKESSPETKPMLIGMVSGIGSLATQSLMDEPTAGHAVSGMLWVYAAVIVATARRGLAEKPRPVAAPTRAFADFRVAQTL